ncbi:ABC transporter ATP-binding protein [Hydrogenophaga sp.]|uniref:ABC transporter ATP-binding protein n=1 Tax=Hydrogenophaga sp. TaxID=1904254 RepID=UPI0027175ACF|nr:ABC transporter ATP-binding protein [Hydrogenophaga sp.]MDO9435185.1 ABC transporter ATP-binding protein [Hydrogenophaga sp.]
MNAEMLRVDHLGRSFRTRDSGDAERWVIQDMSFSVADGEFITVIGPSGSGKSTLLNLLSQIDLPSAGEIWLEGRCVSTASTAVAKPGLDCRIGYVTQDDNLLPWRNLLDNVTFPLKVQGRLDAAGIARARELLAAVGLEGFEKYYPHELSGGMRKRASIIRTLVYDPPIILMDEPFGALDAQTRLQLQNDLLKLWTAKRKTILFVTHDIVEAIGLADRVLVLSRAPTHIAAEHVVDLPRPRALDELLAQPGFAALHERIRALVR